MAEEIPYTDDVMTTQIRVVILIGWNKSLMQQACMMTVCSFQDLKQEIKWLPLSALSSQRIFELDNHSPASPELHKRGLKSPGLSRNVGSYV